MIVYLAPPFSFFFLFTSTIYANALLDPVCHRFIKVVNYELQRRGNEGLGPVIHDVGDEGRYFTRGAHNNITNKKTKRTPGTGQMLGVGDAVMLRWWLSSDNTCTVLMNLCSAIFFSTILHLRRVIYKYI